MEPSDYTSIAVSVQGRVGVIEMIRPEEGNPLEPEGSEREMHDALSRFQRDREIRVVVLTGSGEVFSRGGHKTPIRVDPAEMGGFSLGERLAYGYSYGVFWEYLPEYRKPIIAAVNGLAFGGGCELVESTHIAFAADTATFSKAEINIGIIPTFGGTQRLPRNVGRKAAIELVLSGRTFDAAEAAQLGLVNRVVPGANLLGAALTFARELASKPPLTIAAALTAIHRGMDAAIDDGLAIEEAAFARIVATHDAREGVAAFLEKRSPSFVGR